MYVLLEYINKVVEKKFFSYRATKRERNITKVNNIIIFWNHIPYDVSRCFFHDVWRIADEHNLIILKDGAFAFDIFLSECFKITVISMLISGKKSAI